MRRDIWSLRLSNFRSFSLSVGSTECDADGECLRHFTMMCVCVVRAEWGMDDLVAVFLQWKSSHEIRLNLVHTIAKHELWGFQFKCELLVCVKNLGWGGRGSCFEGCLYRMECVVRAFFTFGQCPESGCVLSKWINSCRSVRLSPRRLSSIYVLKIYANGKELLRLRRKWNLPVLMRVRRLFLKHHQHQLFALFVFLSEWIKTRHTPAAPAAAPHSDRGSTIYSYIETHPAKDC